MRELLDDLDRWRAAGKRCVVGRVVGIEGSGPRDPGAAMAVNHDGEVKMNMPIGNPPPLLKQP
ncbi:MAG: XdhC family protein, partial [Acidimicrobiia bacterium]|nr:XdhC family protein [Acidimicrobiia bacterium]